MGQKTGGHIWRECPFNVDLISAVESQMKDFGNWSAFLEVNYNGKCLFAVVHVLLECCASKTPLIFSAIQNTKKIKFKNLCRCESVTVAVELLSADQDRKQVYRRSRPLN